MEAKRISNPTILIVDDSSLNARILSSWCAKWGFIADVALSGKSAIEKAYNHDYSLIILDILLPDISGFQVFEELSVYRPQMNVIFQSGISKEEFRSKIKREAFFLQKPYYPAEMKELIEFNFEKTNIKMLA
ncbi:hypothetical protein BFP71_12380 [Roseivirga misakiensis]|uniref:Response regulatory domain-containing protein n=2 Tax=Roseivirga misakiensis TaxID=1563681 RepID=A0A1E5SYR7_9BACT|nr:hypothetical protein BFP71_12380 [Roseivirga misakiensis]